MRFKINLLDDGSVVTQDGEYLGTWGTDETDAVYQFTPDGHLVVLIEDVHMGPFCQSIEDWRLARE
jgi:hypothetical protein